MDVFSSSSSSSSCELRVPDLFLFDNPELFLGFNSNCFPCQLCSSAQVQSERGLRSPVSGHEMTKEIAPQGVVG